MLDTVGEYLFLAFSLLAIIFMKVLIAPQKQPTFNIYRKPTDFYWFKVIFMYGTLSLRKFIHSLKSKTKVKEEDLDKAQSLSYHDKAVDAVYFNAGNAKGDYLAIGTARRKDNLVDGFLFLKIAESCLGVLHTPKVPCTSLFKTEDDTGYGAEGLRVYPIIPMKKWKITYEGILKSLDSKEHNVSLDLEWSSDLPYFNFDTDLDPLAVAKSTALEPWSREYFNILKESHQTHFEQFGSLQGTAVIDDKEFKIELDSCRDHSFGKSREWKSFHRYVLHYITAENGDRFAVCHISVPVMFSNLTIGYMYNASEKKLIPLRSCDFQLYQHGEDGNPPEDYSFVFSTSDCKEYTMQINIVDSRHFYISQQWESKVFERFCTAEINGKKGWGVCEWQYRNILGKKVADSYY